MCIYSGVPKIFERETGAVQSQSNRFSGKIFSKYKKSLHIESDSVLSIFCPKNVVMSKKRSSL